MSFQKKLPASTLPEVLISMVIIMAVFTVAIVIYSRITASGFSLTAGQVQGEMESIIREIEEKKQLTEETITIDSIKYHKTAEPYEGFPDLVVIRVEAEQNGKVVGELRKVVGL